MRKALLVLAFGAFGFSASEYMLVGVLSGAANSLRVTMAQAGHFLSAYALGVVAGALLLATVARYAAPKKMLLILAAMFALGNILTSLSEGYLSMLITRFASGLPHGGFFTVASIIAEQIAPKGKKAGAVAMMFSGMTVATLAGVPIGTFLSHLASWRLPYFLIGLSGLVSLYLVYKWLPVLAPMPQNNLEEEASFLKNKTAWLLLLGVILGNGGIFCWLSYISPFMLKLSNLPGKYMMLVMALTGAGMFCGNWASGKLSERFTPPLVAAWVQGLACIVLALLFLFPGNVWVTAGLAFLCAGLMFALTVPEQMMMISAAPNGALLGSAIAQAGFYLGNTIGAFGGGIPLEIGLGYKWTAFFGFVLSAAGLLLLVLYARGQNKQTV